MLPELNHPNICSLIEYSEDSNYYYFYNHNIDGDVLYNLIENSLNESSIIDITLSLLSALEYIEELDLSIINLNPKNILISHDYRSTFLSPGIILKKTAQQAKYAAEEKTLDTYSLRYLSPESLGRITKPIDARSQLYSLGIILFEMINGVAPFTSDNPIEIIHMHTAKPAPEPKLNKQRIPQELSNICKKLLEKMPENRYQSFYELRNELITFQASSQNIKRKYNSTKLYTVKDQQKIAPPKMIYGRSTQLRLLRESFDLLLSGKPNTPFISGESGSGKTYLFNTFLDEIKKENPLFIMKGKFDEHSISTPHSAITQAIENFGSDLLKENDELLETIESNINRDLGDNCAIITSISPSFEKILGKQPELSTLHENESSNRFNDTIIQFFKSISSCNIPTILYIDDIQWAEDSSIELITSIASNTNSLLTAISYRSDEIEKQKISRIRRAINPSKPTIIIKTKNLSLQETSKIVQEMLNWNAPQAQKLAKYTFEQTGGNAFHTVKSILNQYKVKNISINPESDTWEWNKNETLSKKDETNIRKTLDTLFDYLDKETKEILQTASCLGNNFNKDTLLYFGYNIKDLERSLHCAEDSGIILRSENDFYFTHDQTRQSIYSSIDNNKIGLLHLNIATTLYSNLVYCETSYDNYDLARHINKARYSLMSNNQKSISSKINYWCAKQSITQGAYSSANYYASQALHFFDKKTNRIRPSLFDIEIIKTKSLFLSGQKSEAIKFAKKTLSLASTPREKIESYAITKNILLNMGRSYLKAVNIGLSICKDLGIFIPGSIEEVIHETRKASDEISAIYNKITKNITTSTNLQNNNTSIEIDLLSQLWEACYYAGLTNHLHLISTYMTRISLTEGDYEGSEFGYVTYAAFCIERKRFNEAKYFGDLAINNITNSSSPFKPKVYNLYNNYIGYFFNNFHHSHLLYEKSLNYSKTYGDYLFGAWAALFSSWSLFISGSPLKKVRKVIDENKKFIEKTGDRKIIDAINCLEIAICSIDGSETTPFYEQKFIQRIQSEWDREKFLPGGLWLCVIAGQLSSTLEKRAEYLSFKTKSNIEQHPSIAMFPKSQFYFFDAINIKFFDNTSTIPEETIEYYRIMSQNNPSSFEYMLYILLALKNSDNRQKSSEFFIKSIHSACNSSNLYAKAISNEMYADFLMGKDENMCAKHANIACAFYSEWGAIKKIKQLKSKYIKYITRLNYLDNNKLPNQTTIHENTYLDLEKTDLIGAIRTNIKLSSKNCINDILYETLTNIIESTGAQRAAYFTEENKILHLQMIVDNHGTSEINEIITRKTIPMEIIKETINLNEDIIIDNAGTNQDYKNISCVIEKSIKSVICTKFFHKNNQQTIIYLDNSLIPGIFSKKHVSIIQINMQHASIYLENISLMNQLKSEIVHRKNNEEELKTGEERMRLAQQYANIGTWEMDLSKNKLLWSNNVYEMFGFSKIYPPEKTYDLFSNSVHPNDKDLVDQSLKKSFYDGNYEIIHRIIRPDNSIRWMREQATIFFGRNNKPKKALGIVQDITDWKNSQIEQEKLRNQLLQAQKMESIGHLTGGIAHDFNNILTSIMGFSQLAIRLNEKNGSGKMNVYLNEILNSGNRAQSLVKQMLTFSRKTDHSKTRINIFEQLSEIVLMLDTTFPSTIKFSLSSSLKNLFTTIDPVHFHQVLVNLAINARDAMQNYGTIRIYLCATTKPKGDCDSCHQNLSGKYAVLQVLDNGSGINRQHLSHIFEPFFTTKEIGKGSGMGLSMVHGIMHETGGHIQVHSFDDIGSCFQLYFPIADTSHQELHNNKFSSYTSTPSVIDTKVVLLIHKDPTLSTFISTCLPGDDFNVICCSNLHVAMQHIGEDSPPLTAVIIGHSGDEHTPSVVTGFLQHLQENVPIFLLDDLGNHASNALYPESIGRLSLPLDPGQLLSAINHQELATAEVI
ncbi:MAG: AAA family ATPase [Gammaproteobacteria bacterium]|nr:AAA family ATPase [Gammaproteobacteria bacterium]